MQQCQARVSQRCFVSAGWLRLGLQPHVLRVAQEAAAGAGRRGGAASRDSQPFGARAEGGRRPQVKCRPQWGRWHESRRLWEWGRPRCVCLKTSKWVQCRKSWERLLAVCNGVATGSLLWLLAVTDCLLIFFSDNGSSGTATKFCEVAVLQCVLLAQGSQSCAHPRSLLVGCRGVDQGFPRSSSTLTA